VSLQEAFEKSCTSTLTEFEAQNAQLQEASNLGVIFFKFSERSGGMA